MANINERKSKRVNAVFDDSPPFPEEIFLEPNSSCNHQCFFCANHKMTRSRSFLDKALGFRLMQEAFELGTRAIGLYATGEPFMYPGLADFVKEAKRIGYEYVFLDSNGALATPEKAGAVIDAGLDSIKFSINAGSRASYKKIHGHDNFDKVIENIKWFNQYRREHNPALALYVSMVKTAETAGEEQVLIHLLTPYVDKVMIRECSNQGGMMLENNQTQKIDARNILGSRRPDEREVRCTEPFNRLTISSEGYLTICPVDYENNLVIADMSKTTLKEAWSCNLYRQIRRKHLANDLSGLICYSCINNVQADYSPLHPECRKPFKGKNEKSL